MYVSMYVCLRTSFVSSCKVVLCPPALTRLSSRTFAPRFSTHLTEANSCKGTVTTISCRNTMLFVNAKSDTHRILHNILTNVYNYLANIENYKADKDCFFYTKLVSIFLRTWNSAVQIKSPLLFTANIHSPLPSTRLGNPDTFYNPPTVTHFISESVEFMILYITSSSANIERSVDAFSITLFCGVGQVRPKMKRWACFTLRTERFNINNMYVSFTWRSSITLGITTHYYTPCPEKKRPCYFQLQLSHSLVDFYNFYTVGNRNEHSTVTCNLVT